MLRIHAVVVMASCLLGLAGCKSAPAPAPFNPDDPVALAVIDSMLKVTMEGAATVDADKVLAMAEGQGELTFITGDVLLTGLEPIRERFRQTYSGLQSQQNTLTERRVRLLSPDVAVALAVGEGTYTDKAGWTSAPVDIGMTIVFVREDGQWRARHAHQSIAP
jgi:uncharacterized protein (TIGR02246 family)